MTPQTTATQHPRDELLARLASFRRLNPMTAEAEYQDLLALADRVPGDCFGVFSDFAERLLDLYMRSPWKQAEIRVLNEYFDFLDRTSRLLQEEGEIAVEQQEAARSQQSVSLVPRYLYSPQDWFRVLNRANLPKSVVLAVDAAQRRNQLLGSVMEQMLAILHRIDHARSLQWELEFLDRNRGDLDPDVVRDVLRVWRGQRGLPTAAIEWGMVWSDDQNLARQWPTVAREADLLLRENALRSWERAVAPRTAHLRHLHLLLTEDLFDDERLLRWLEMGIADIGRSLRSIISLCREGDSPVVGRPAWQSAAMVREIRAVEGLFPPVLLLADAILAVPEGSYRFALAFFGMAGEERRRWRERVQTVCGELIRRELLRGLRDGVGPLKSIRRYCFGDADLLRRMAAELDYVTKEFDSMAQRDKVVEHLAVSYASFREPALLAEEIARRYRELMRALHEDSLRRLLTGQDFALVQSSSVLRDLSSMAADARRFLTRRRALGNTLESMMSVESEFARCVRRRRLYFVRKLLV